MSQYRIAFAELDEELRLEHRLGQHGVKVLLEGLTTPTSRKEAFRAAIIKANQGWVIVGPKPGTHKPETFAEFFERIFHEPLITPTPRRGKKYAYV